MPRHDLHASRDGLLLNCQADAMDELNTRLVVPLRPEREVPRPTRPLHPVFDIDGERYVMVTHHAAAVPVRELGPVVGTLRDHEYVIANAFDMLLFGI